MATANWELLEAHRHALTTFLRGKCPREDDVEDCVQEAMLRVAQLPDLDHRRLRGLLKTVAYNVAMDMHRDRRRQSAAFARIGTLQSPAPDVVALDSCEARSLAAHARHLSPRERAALRGRADGFAPHETAALLGDTPRSVHLALSRARTSLRRLAEVAGALVIFVRRHGRGSLRVTAPSIVAVTLGLAMLAPQLGPQEGSLPSPSPPPGVAGMGWHAPTAAPGLGRTTLAPVARSASTPAPVPPPPPAVSGWGLQRRTIIAASAPGPQGINPSVSVVEANPNTPLLTGIQNCLKPGAIALGPQHFGCVG